MALAWRPVDTRSDPDEPWCNVDPGELVDASGLLAELIHRPVWHREAACRGKGTEPWFPSQGGDYEAAQAVCQGCAVRAECLAAAEEFGIWGGLSARARKVRRLSPSGDKAA